MVWIKCIMNEKQCWFPQSLLKGIMEKYKRGFLKFTLSLVWKDFVYLYILTFFVWNQAILILFQSTYHFTSVDSLLPGNILRYSTTGNEMTTRAKVNSKDFASTTGLHRHSRRPVSWELSPLSTESMYVLVY